MFFDKKMNGGMYQMIEYSGNGKNPTNNSHNINQKGMPLLRTHNMQDSHGISLILKKDHGELRQHNLIQPGRINIVLFPLRVYLVLLNDIKEVCISDAEEGFFDEFLAVEVSETVLAVVLLLVGAETQLVYVVGHVE
jgi:hypothetical protein